MKHHHLNKIIIALSSLVVISAALVGGFYLGKLQSGRVETPTVKTDDTQTIVPEEEISQEPVQEVTFEIKDGVKWNTPQEIKVTGMFKDLAEIEGTGTTFEDYILDMTKFEKVGTIIDEKSTYNNGEVIRAQFQYAGPSFANPIAYYIKKNNTYYLLSSLHDGGDAVKDMYTSNVVIDSQTKIALLQPPATITTSNGIVLTRIGDSHFGDYDAYETTWYQSAGTLSDGSTYYKPADNRLQTISENSTIGVISAAFYLKQPDGLFIPYYAKQDFITEVPAFQFNDGSYNTDPYDSGEFGGCGMTMLQAELRGVSEDELTPTGRIANRQFFEFKDTRHVFLSAQFTTLYDVNYQEYISSHPIIIIKDEFGRMLKYQNRRFQPAAECGKPVIYLYPEKETEINVRVSPVGGFSYTDPVYDEATGWNVIAKPTGELVEKLTGITYPYLFWEGRGGLYETPKKGWVVARKDVPALITEKLQAFNLNEKEIADFNEFWLPRMQNDPYYFITFMGTRVMNELAPLEITPTPDTIIRVLMDYEGLQEPKAVEGYEINAPERSGFTVIEWGGVLGR